MIIKFKPGNEGVFFQKIPADHTIKRLGLEELRESSKPFAAHNRKVFVVLAANDQVETLEPELDKIDGVEIQFSSFTDGRAFSKAYKLRTQLRFKGEIKAVGDILPDQLLFLFRCGFDVVEFDGPVDPKVLEFSLNAFSRAYQGGRGEKEALPALSQKSKAPGHA